MTSTADTNFLEIISKEIQQLLEPIIEASKSDTKRRELFYELGWDLDAISNFPVTKLIQIINEVNQVYVTLTGLIDNGIKTFDDVKITFDSIQKIINTIKNFKQMFVDAGLPVPPQFDKLGSELLALLVISYLQKYHPTIYSVAELLTIVRPRIDVNPTLDVTGKVIRYPHRPGEIMPERIIDLIKDPLLILRNEYFVNNLTSASDVDIAIQRLFPRLINLLESIGFETNFGINENHYPVLDDHSIDIASRMMTFYLNSDDELGNFGVILALSPKDDLGLTIVPFGNLNLTRILGNWEFGLNLTGGMSGFSINSGGLTFPQNVSDVKVNGEFTAIKIPNKEGAFMFGASNGTHLKIGQFKAIGKFELSQEEQNYDLLLEISSSSLVIAAGEGDGFLQKILPAEPIKIDFSITPGISNKRGFYFSGGANLEHKISVHKSLGPVRIDFVTIRLSPKDGKLELFVTLTAGAKIGPLALTVEDIGLKANLDFEKFGLDLKFKLPKGVGVSIDASSVKGGGYLFIDEDNGQYAGVLQLQIQNIGLTAIGILNTKLPDNKTKYSLLIIITADFPAIQLGFGFALLGLGGILGLNRTMKVDILRDGIKNHTLDSVLFPQNPIENATKIISDLQMIFPPAEGRFVIGLMAKISWGTPPIITGEIGLAIEIPDPIRIAILGKIKAILPSQKEAILQLRLDVIGIIDFGKKELSIDASLYDSKIAQFDLSGDIALRASWGDQPVFALACGGFHPRYQPPSSFPKLARLQLSLGSGGNPRLSLQAYMALTSNTVQFGARLDLYAEAFGCSVQGVLGFDTLIQFDPFAFMVDLYGGIAFKMGDTVLGAVTLDAQLSGPNPYHAYGKASIEILGIPVSVTFDETWGQQIRQISSTTDLWPLLEKEFKKDGNWSATLPVNSSRAAIYSAKSIGFLDPFGSLVVEQRVLPLNYTLTKFGNSKPTSENYFDIKQVVLGGKSFGNLPEKRDFFAVSQFSDLSDDEKLSRPDFDQMKSGIMISYDEITPNSDRIIETEIVLDTFIIDDKAKKILTESSRRFLDSSNLALMATIGGQDIYRSNRLVSMADETYVVASTNDMTIRTDMMNTENMTKTAAISMMNSYLAKHPEEKGNLQVMLIQEALTV